MNKLIIINEEKENILKMYGILNEDFAGIEKGRIKYVTKNGKTLYYQITHSVSDFEVIDFDIRTGKFKLKGNFLAGTQEGVLKKEILNQILLNMEMSKPSFDVPIKGGKDKVTFKLV